MFKFREAHLSASMTGKDFHVVSVCVCYCVRVPDGGMVAASSQLRSVTGSHKVKAIICIIRYQGNKKATK